MVFFYRESTHEELPSIVGLAPSDESFYIIDDIDEFVFLTSSMMFHGFEDSFTFLSDIRGFWRIFFFERYFFELFWCMRDFSVVDDDSIFFLYIIWEILRDDITRSDTF